MTRTRTRTFRPRSATAVALVLAGGLVLAACGSGGTGGSGGSAGTAGTSTHTMDTAMGRVKVPDHPRRVVVLDTAELDSAITLGVRPVGSTHADVKSGFLDYLPRDKVAGIKDVGAMLSPDLEAIAALKPDLILTSKIRHGDKYQQLSAIAPTVMTESTGYPWKANFQVHADALGRQAEARKVVAAYTAHTKQVVAALGGPAKAAATDVDTVRFVEGADIRIYGRKNYIGTILTDLGVGRPAVVDKAKDGFSYDVSPERIDLANADVLFHATYGDPAKAKETQTTSSGLWKNLTAVKNGKSFAVDDQLWFQGIGYTAAGKILDELRADLAR
ncbi:iron-siderophore ABC transporter substrate-binding protein [Streptomyces sp. NBC_01267]|uniref:ABC transporter substrate-binding protein n=1 Tax=Streptomyces sp. NBC_01267 TaxID=2903805 RepID=UPI002E3316C6|nr:iron-siderophore ABC transporter substrate-binding protein [Streptomyces sp. NBC_01267]